MNFDFDIVTLVGYLGAAFYIGSALGLWTSPELLLNFILLPLNALRMRQIQKLTKEIQRASQDTPVSEWLLPQMTRRTFKAGEILFRKGEHADMLVYLARGKVKIQE